MGVKRPINTPPPARKALLRERGCPLLRVAKESSVNSRCRPGPIASMDQGNMVDAVVLKSCRASGREKLPGSVELFQRDWLSAFPNKAQGVRLHFGVAPLEPSAP